MGGPGSVRPTHNAVPGVIPGCMETTQTWKSQETGAGTEGSLRETQDNPAPTHSGIVNKEERMVLYAQIPKPNLMNLCLLLCEVTNHYVH